MEFKRRYNYRRIITVIYVVALSVYLIIGLQPAEATQYEISGEVKIPAIGLSSAVTSLEIEDHKLKTPDTIVGSYSKDPSKVFLFGHSSVVFKELKRVKINDEIIYNDKSYHIVSTKVILKANIDMNEILAPAEDNTLIIMTCAGLPVGEKDATHRLIITAEEK